jgi:adenine-specific DNA glycosylase
VLRVANRIGIARSADPEVVEQQLCEALPPAEWTRCSDTLILHGRRICKPKPLCDRCVVRAECDYYRSLTPKSARPTAAAKRGEGSPQPAGKRGERTRPRQSKK